MPRKQPHTIDELELNQREIETLKYLFWYRTRHGRYPSSPTHRELFDHLNRVLPKQKPSGKPALVSLEQTRRLVDQLRAKGVLIQTEYHVPRSIVLSEFGERVAARYVQ